MSRHFRRAAAVFVILSILALVLTACSDSDDEPSSPTPTSVVEVSPTTAPSPTAAPEATPTPGAPGDGPTGAAPAPGPCLTERAVCDMAEQLLPVLEAGDAGAFFALAEPVEAICRAGSAGFGGPSPSLCRGSSDGEVREGYWDVQAGEGLIVPEADLRSTLARWFAAIDAASGSDSYASGELRIGSVACGRDPGQPSGVCGDDFIRAHFTFINNAEPSQGTGLPGQRITFHISMHRAADGELKVDGFGTTVPPNTVLLSFWLPAIADDGSPLILEYYPWTP